MAPGSSATFTNNKSRCPFCRSWESIPDGTFRATVEGFIEVLEKSGDPAGRAKELFDVLQKSRTPKDLSKIKKSSRFAKLKKWLPDSPEKIAAYIAIIYTLIQLWKRTPNVHVGYDAFVMQYNQTVNIENNNEFTSNNNTCEKNHQHLHIGH
jgi:predicted Zn-ribbon and HTH transcriptional regulator